MKRFIFRLDSLLRFREIEKNKALDQYAKAIQFRQNAQNQYEKGLLELQELYKIITSRRNDTSTAAEQILLNQTKNNIIIKNQKNYEFLMDSQRSEQNALKELLQHKKRLDILLKLKEKQLHAHNYKSLRLEEKAIEALIYNRNNSLNSLR